MLTREQVWKYQEIYFKRFNREISYQDALAQATKLIRLIESVYKPMTESEYQKLQERHQQTGDLKA